MTNPLLNPAILHHDIDFQTLQAQHFGDAFDTLLPAVRAEHEAAVLAAPSFEVLFERDAMSRQLGMVSLLLAHLTSVADTAELRAVYSEYVPKVSALFEELSLDTRGYEQLKAYAASDACKALHPTRARMVVEALKHYEREGIALPAAGKARLTAIGVRLTELTQQFENNLTDFADEAALAFTVSELAGVPPRTLENAKRLPDGRLELNMVDGGFADIWSHCDVESTRQAVYEFELQEGLEPERDNRPLLAEIVALQQERAQLLGYASFAEYAVEDNMVGTATDAIAFCRKLADLSLDKARAENAALATFGAKLLGRSVAQHDWGYVREQARRTHYHLDSEKIREYFPVCQVVHGLFELLEALYGIRFVPDDSKSRWHPDVQVYAVTETATGASRGLLYLDLFSRRAKEGGAWMNAAVSRHEGSGRRLLPVAYIVCNVPKDQAQEPTFEFGDVVTLFHEMGHALHNLLSEVTEDYFSGLNHVQHDAVELPSQFMENFCWDYATVRRLSRHVRTGEALPRVDYENLQQSKLFMGANTVLNQARWSLIDLLLYSQPGVAPAEVEQEVTLQYQVRERDPRVRLLPGFSHIFSGGYSAGYYAYHWAEMLSADAFAALREQGDTFADQRQAALRFRQHVLSTGGEVDMADNFVAFRGRAPELSHLLKDYDLV